MDHISLKYNISGERHIAFFDFDRTITKAISGKELATAAFRKGLMSWADLLRALYLSVLFRLKIKQQLKIIQDMVAWVRGVPDQTIQDLCSEVFNRRLKPSIFDEARSEIKTLKENNVKVVILSSALMPVCQRAAVNLGIDDIICSELEVDNGYCTGRPVGKLCFGEEKAVRLIEYCRNNNISPANSWYYGDSISDLHVLSVVGNPVCVNPDNKLKAAAQKLGWKIVLWNH